MPRFSGKLPIFPTVVLKHSSSTSRMKLQRVLLTLLLLISVSAPDQHPDFGHHDDIHPNTLMETNADVLEDQTSRDVPDTNWDALDINKDNYEDADWHPPSSFLDTSDLPPDDPPLIRSSADQTQNNDSSSSQCGEFSGQVTSDGQCRLGATLHPMGTPQNHCPDIFRCTNNISYWLQQNQDGRNQLEELKETMLDLQEELRIHQHRVKALETQSEDRVTLNATFGHRLRSLEVRHAEADTLLRVHAALLYELQATLRNLSTTLQHMGRNTNCKVNVVRTAPPPLGMRDTLLPDCASLYHNGVRRSGVYTIVLSPGTPLPVYCDMDTEGGGWTTFQRRRDGSVSFNRGWTDYRDGFGEARGEHWLGNQQLHLLSNQGHNSLRIDLQDWGHSHRHAQYSSFSAPSGSVFVCTREQLLASSKPPALTGARPHVPVELWRKCRGCRAGVKVRGRRRTFGPVVPCVVMGEYALSSIMCFTETWLHVDFLDHSVSSSGFKTVRVERDAPERIEDEENRYRLHVSGFSGTVEDSFGWYHNLQGFSTPDTGDICAEISHAGWWFHQCFYANLNGVYYKGGRYSLKAQNLLGPDGIVWFSWKDSDFYSLKAVSMMVRPHNFRPRLSP